MRAQVTVFIILGLVVLLLAIAFFLFLPSLKQQQTKLQAGQAQALPKEVEPVVTFVEACIDAAAKEGLRLLGGQGGYLYEAQGSLKLDYAASQEGKFYLNYRQLQVPYRIQKSIGGPGCAIDPPSYPSINAFYPYADASANPASKQYEKSGCFGRRVPLDVEKARLQLEEFISSHLEENCKLDSFPLFSITAGAPTTTIVSTPSRTAYTVSYPIELVNKNTQARAQLSNYTITHPFSLNHLYDFVNTLTSSDVSDPRFDIAGTDDPGFGVSVITDQYSKDDVVSLVSPQLKIDGQPFVFAFARRNRPPALEYVDFTSSQLTRGVVVNVGDLVLNGLAAVDPDEDIINITVNLAQEVIAYSALFPNGTREDVPSTHILSDLDLDASGQAAVVVAATDKQFTDTQAKQFGVQP